MPEGEKRQTGTLESELGSPEAALVEKGFRPHRLFAALTHSYYRYFFAGALLSNIGTWMQMIALGWVVWEMTNSSFYVGLVSFTANLPVFALVLFAGVFADRIDKKKLIIAAQTVLMVLAFILAILASLDLLTVPLIILISLSGGVFTAVTFPAWVAIISDIVPGKDLLNAIALNSAQFNTARLIGPALAGAVLAASGPAANFWINAFSFLFVILAFFFIHPARRPKAEKKSVLSDLKEGFAFARSKTDIITLLAVVGLNSLFGTAYMGLMPVFAGEVIRTGVIGTGKLGLGILFASNGAGAVIGALVVAYLSSFMGKETLIKTGITLFSLFLIAFSFTSNFYLACFILILAGAAFLTTTSSINTALQQLSPHRIRGRIMSMFVWMFLGMMPFSALLAGAVSEKTGPQLAIRIGAALLLVTAAVLIVKPSLTASLPGTDHPSD